MELDELVFFDEIEGLVENLEARSEVPEFGHEFALNYRNLQKLFFYERLANDLSGFRQGFGVGGFLGHGVPVI